MDVFKGLTSRIIKSGNRYFPNKLRTLEFVLFVAFYSLATYMMNLTPPQYQGVVSTVQSFAALYLAFRFGYLGMFFALLFIGNELRIITRYYLQTQRPEFIVAIAVKSFSIVCVIIMSILAVKQEQHKERLRQLSITDELTGLYNQRYFHQVLQRALEKPVLPGVGLIMIDIDNFKMLNDIHGHETGDAVIHGTGAILKFIANSDQIACRYGGDEFAVILPKTSLEDTQKVAHYFQAQFQVLKANYYPEELDEKVTLSMGLSQYPDLSKSKDELISHADMALYHAKNLGKDKIHFYQDVFQKIRSAISSDDQQLIGGFKALLSTITVKDQYTLGHSERVSTYAMMIGEALQLKPERISMLQYAGLLHDIGKIELPTATLNKLTPLTDEEFAAIRQHPIYSEKILEPLGNIDTLLDCVRHHHERYDGCGYPDGLRGDRISLEARILCVADAYDAMLSNRPYSRSISSREAFQELERCAGSQFDPEVVKVFIETMKQNSSSI
jgi:diguanylate cyclase (GGDEF)-like protein